MTDSRHDVVVVGAGLAGLRAARVLCRRGLDVVVVEAADRPGGRVATDVVDGFRCDRGFQVTNTSYPALRAAVDLDALDLRAFEPAAAVRGPDGALHTYADPRRRPALLPGAAVDRLVPPWGKVALAAWTARVLAGAAAGVGARRAVRGRPTSPRRASPARPSTGCCDRSCPGCSGRPSWTTSAAFVRLVWRSFALGTIGVPAAGMGAIPAQLAAGLPPTGCGSGSGWRRWRPGRCGSRARARRAGRRRGDRPG